MSFLDTTNLNMGMCEACGCLQIINNVCCSCMSSKMLVTPEHIPKKQQVRYFKELWAKEFIARHYTA